MGQRVATMYSRMWKSDEDPLDCGFRERHGDNKPFTSRVRIELPPPFSGGAKDSFPSWSRQYEVAVQALVGGSTGSDYNFELIRLLPTRLTNAAFLLWDSLPKAVQEDYDKVKEKLQEAFGRKHFLERFRANLSARPRAPGESLEVYAAEISRLVHEAFPGYGDIAHREEKFRRFLAGLDPALRAKCHEQGATDLDEALIIAGRCEMAREAHKMDFSNKQVHQPPTESGAAAAVSSVTDGYGWRSALDRLAEDMREMKVEMRRMAEENNRLRANRWRDERKAPHPVHGGQCQCTCGEQGCPSRSGGEQRGRSPDRGWRDRNADRSARERDYQKRDYQSSYNNRAYSPDRRSPGPSRSPSYDDAQRRRNVRFLSPKREDQVSQSGNEM